MTRNELKALPDGTIIFNGNTEGVIRTDPYINMKCIEIMIPIDAMRNDAEIPEERPQLWRVLEDE